MIKRTAEECFWYRTFPNNVCMVHIVYMITLLCLVTYINDTWVESRMWPPTSWSVFGQSVRTNNDVEGWHHGFNGRAKPMMPFYQLTTQLFEEADQVSNPCCIRYITLPITSIASGGWLCISLRLFKLCGCNIVGC